MLAVPRPQLYRHRSFVRAESRTESGSRPLHTASCADPSRPGRTPTMPAEDLRAVEGVEQVELGAFTHTGEGIEIQRPQYLLRPSQPISAVVGGHQAGNR